MLLCRLVGLRPFVLTNGQYMDESQNKSAQLWTIEQSGNNGEARYNGNGSLRPIYLLQAQQPPPTLQRLRQIHPNGTPQPQTQSHPSESRYQSNEQKPPSIYSRGRSSSPPLRLAHIRGVTRNTRGQSSSPPEYTTRRIQNIGVRRAFATDASSDSSQSIRSSPPRANWHRDFQSAIPVPVTGEICRSRFRRRHRDNDDLSASQPMIALPRHFTQNPKYNGGVGSAPVVVHQSHRKNRTKSPSPTHFSTDKFSISQDSGINHQTSSSGSESSDYYTPPAEPYLSIQPSDSTKTIKNHREDSFEHSDRSDSPQPPRQPRERFINLEDNESTSDFDEAEEKKVIDSDETDFVRSLIYQKLHDEHINAAASDPPFRETIAEKRLSKSHADLSEVKKFTRKTINSAPLVKHLKDLENGIDFKYNNNNHSTLDEESRTSLTSSVIELKSLSQSQTDIRSLTSQDLRSLNGQDNRSLNGQDNRSLNGQDNRSLNSQDNRSLNNQDNRSLNSQDNRSLNSLDNRSLNNQDIRSVNSQTDLKSMTELRSLNSSQGNLSQGLNLSQKDLRGSNLDLNDSQINLQYPDEEQEEKIVKYPDIIRKKSLPSKPKIELKRRPSNIPTKVPGVLPEALRNFPKPREGLSEVISQLESPEWEQSMKGLQGLVRLVRNHQDTVEGQLHTVCVLLGRHVKNLRSQVARAACSAAGEMFQIHKKTLEPELEELTVPLLQRTADTNKFLRGDANAALDQMCLNMTASRAVTVLTARGAMHHNAVVRCVTARLFTELVQRLGSNRVYQLPREIRDKILVVGANMLMEGSLETRKHAKNMFSELSTHPQFQRSLSEAITPTTLRNISKQLSNLK